MITCIALTMALLTPPCDDVVAFAGLHGGAYDVLASHATALGQRIVYLDDQAIREGSCDLSTYRLVLFQHVRDDAQAQYVRLVRAGKRSNPALRVLAISDSASRKLPELVRDGLLEEDHRVTAYYQALDRENLRRLLLYLRSTYLGSGEDILPPRDVEAHGLHHPDHEGLFENVEQFLTWSRERGRDVDAAPRVFVTAHYIHLVMQQPAVVDALIRALEQRGALAACVLDTADGPAQVSADGKRIPYEQALLDFAPQAIIHTCHSRDELPLREEIDVPHVHSMFFRRASIEDWQAQEDGLAPNEIAFQIVSQELRGAIEPQIGAGTLTGNGSEEAFQPIEERIDHVAARAIAWAKLRRTPNPTKRVAVVYYDREMGKSELMRGSATGMFLNAPRSLVRVLHRMRDAGYAIAPVPRDEDELVQWMQERGRQIGIWAPGVLDQLARSGDAVLIPTAQYVQWFETKVPEALRAQVVKRWGKAPGEFLSWQNEAGESFLVVPRIDLGNVILLPQPLRGEAHDTTLVHDAETVPPHNYLATYFWLQEGFQADALVHFGTHGTEFLLPGRGVGLGPDDWPDIVLGHLPNVNPWVVNNLGESSPVKRRGYAVIVDYQTPPSVAAELADTMRNLHDDVHKWETLEPGALRERFRDTIEDQVRSMHLDRDLDLDLTAGRSLRDDDIGRIAEYLHALEVETTPVDLHVLGEPPRDELMVPYLATCVGKRFHEAVFAHAAEHDEHTDASAHAKRALAEEALTLIVRQGLDAAQAMEAMGYELRTDEQGQAVLDGVTLVRALQQGFARSGDEIGNVLRALDGRFIAPGPGSSPDRNPAALPTGRNLFVMNPEEIPTRASWELGRELVRKLLDRELETRGRYPKKVAFSLSSSATFQDYGVMEAQILDLIGVRPIWNERNQVQEVEIVPREELGRPRIDVFLAGQGYYRDTLPTRMQLLDQAVRQIAALEEADNRVYLHTNAIRATLSAQGVPEARADQLAKARIFGGHPKQNGSPSYYYLVERSGTWDTRDDLMRVYLANSTYVYTEGAWGESARDAYTLQVQDAEVVLRNWSDRTRSPLSNKYFWYKGGSLSMAIEHLTGRAPTFFLSDVRDPENVDVIRAEEAVRRDFRVRVTNRPWIEGLMKEGYAGADQVAVHVSNMLGWKVTREDSVTDTMWEDVRDVFVRDSKQLGVREWFEAENPYAYQEMIETLLEAARKGYWNASPETLLELARELAESVLRHGENGGLRGGGNTDLERFVEHALHAPGTEPMDALAAAYRARTDEPSKPTVPEASAVPASARLEAVDVRGPILEPVARAPAEDSLPSTLPWRHLIVGTAVLFALLLGYLRGRGPLSV